VCTHGRWRELQLHPSDAFAGIRQQCLNLLLVSECPLPFDARCAANRRNRRCEHLLPVRAQPCSLLVWTCVRFAQGKKDLKGSYLKTPPSGGDARQRQPSDYFIKPRDLPGQVGWAATGTSPENLETALGLDGPASLLTYTVRACVRAFVRAF
jgi:hypothetical protein